ncbi:hypothetical protein CRUP_018551 [Coryphaenoides rupestris]|nr:hypothetical protein CRUP_018551 [Coryphaenoides rupestris]
MPCEAKHRVLILYGSQKGQAQAVAEGIAAEAADHGLVAEVSCLSQHEEYKLERESTPVVFVVSTTGDGEPPDTTVKFVKSIKRRTLASDHYQHLHYALLALGDTNYANFCNCGKSIDRRLQELGANHFYATGHADDGIGLELVLDPWIEGVWDAIKRAISKMASITRDTPLQENLGDVAKENPGLTSPPHVELDRLSLADNQASVGTGDSADSKLTVAGVPSTDTPKLMPAAAQTDQAGEDHAVSEPSLTRSLPPLSQCSLNVPAMPPPYLEVTLLPGDTEEEAHPTMMTYMPGDSFDVLCPNRASEVDALLQRLGLQHQRHHRVQIAVLSFHGTSPISSPCSTCSRGAWKSEVFPRSAHKRRLQELCSKQGSADYNGFIRDPSLCLEELLDTFPSCTPPLSLLIEHLPKLQPRPYSAASSSLRHPGRLLFVFNVVQLPACCGRPRCREGLCSGWLADLVAPALESPGGPAPLPKIHVNMRPVGSFRAPSDPAVPLIMVGPGTGVAPFIGFLQQREIERRDNPDAVFGETWLFFGCRHKEQDYLFR